MLNHILRLTILLHLFVVVDIIKIKTLYEQMLREDKADTYKQQKWHTYVQMLVDDVGFNDIFSI